MANRWTCARMYGGAGRRYDGASVVRGRLAATYISASLSSTMCEITTASRGLAGQPRRKRSLLMCVCGSSVSSTSQPSTIGSHCGASSRVCRAAWNASSVADGAHAPSQVARYTSVACMRRRMTATPTLSGTSSATRCHCVESLSSTCSDSRSATLASSAALHASVTLCVSVCVSLNTHCGRVAPMREKKRGGGPGRTLGPEVVAVK